MTLTPRQAIEAHGIQWMNGKIEDVDRMLLELADQISELKYERRDLQDRLYDAGKL